MKPKPKHLGAEYGAQFQDASVVAAYIHRPSYPPETFDILESLIVPDHSSLLDLGCGPGPIARGMLGRVARIDAVDWSAAMIEAAKLLPGGDDPSITWIIGRAEDAPLNLPYGLIAAGSSLHWMDWPVVIPRLRATLAPGAVIAIVEEGVKTTQWSATVGQLIAVYSTNRDFQPYNLVDELERRNLFQAVGYHRTASVPFVQSVDDYIESIHARNGFSRDRMIPEAANAFDDSVRAIITPYATDDTITLQVFSTIVWGK